MMIDFANIQGLIVQGYGHPCSRHLLFRFPAPPSGRAFLRSLATTIAWADQAGEARPATLTNVGISYTGLAALALPSHILDAFPDEFREPPDAVAMGDYGASAPDRWWHGQFTTPDMHAVVHLYASDDATLDSMSHSVRDQANTAGVVELFPTARGMPLEGRLLADNKVHFGYRDGISQPEVDWGDGQGNASFRHFLLGYSNNEIGSQPEDSPAKEIFRDSSYAVLRWMYQDVARFNQFLAQNAESVYPNLAPDDAKELLAAKLVGRWRNGTPLALSPDRPDAGLKLANSIMYKDDPNGEITPFSAHVRATDPRDQPLSPTIVDGVPRLIRRGVPFGPELDSAIDDGRERGLIGIFICASIQRQFYELMRWMKRADFSPVFKGNIRLQDPFSNRSVPDAKADFNIPVAGGRIATCVMPDLVRTLGTALFLLPSRTGLDYLAADPPPAATRNASEKATA